MVAIDSRVTRVALRGGVRPGRRAQAGFSMIEVLVTFVILVIGLLFFAVRRLLFRRPANA